MIDHPHWAKRPTVNPYRYAANEIGQRLRWDLHPESWRSRRLMGDWHNKYRGQKAVILCNGPSLLQSDLSLLGDTFTFGLNKINLLFEQSNFRPSCVVCANPLVLEQNAEFYTQTELPLFLSSVGLQWVRSRPNIIFFHSSEQQKFARNCSMSLFQGATVTFVALQLAFHFGFEQVALIGCDHNFKASGPANKVVESDQTDPNHFAPNYFAGGMKWQLPDLLRSEVAYTMARDVFELDNRQIFNATEGGKLEVFPRIALKDFVE